LADVPSAALVITTMLDRRSSCSTIKTDQSNAIIYTFPMFLIRGFFLDFSTDES
jgi:hypothetical protein